MPTQTFLFQVNTSQGIISNQIAVVDGVEFDFDSSGLDGGNLIGSSAAGPFNNILLPTHTGAYTKASPSINVPGGQIRSLVMQAVGGDIQIVTNASSAPSFPVTAGAVGSTGDKVLLAAGQVIFWQQAFIDTTGNYAAFGVNPFPTADVTSLWLYSVGGSAILKIRAILQVPVYPLV